VIYSRPRSQKIRWFLLWVVLPISLLSIGLALSVVQTYRQQVSLLSLIQNHSSNLLHGDLNIPLYQHQKIGGEFIASENYLGIVSVRFKTFLRINDDFLRFRIRQASDSAWFYQAAYKVDQFQPDALFPFGFPVVENSQGKKFIFEIESTQGQVNNSVAVSSQFPSFVSIYKFPRRAVLGDLDQIEFTSWKRTFPPTYNKTKFSLIEIYTFLTKKLPNLSSDTRFNSTLLKNSIVSFFTKKIANLAATTDFTWATIFHLLPFFLYMTWLWTSTKNIRWPVVFSISPIALIILESLTITSYQDLITLEVSLVWILTVYYYRFSSSASYFIGFAMLILSPIFLYSNNQLLAEKYAVWSFILFAIAISQNLLEYRRSLLSAHD